MFKNAVIAILSTSLYFVCLGEFYFLAFVSLSTILFFIVWQIEEWINDAKRKLVFKRRIQKKIAQTKIPQHTPTKAS